MDEKVDYRATKQGKLGPVAVWTCRECMERFLAREWHEAILNTNNPAKVMEMR